MGAEESAPTTSIDYGHASSDQHIFSDISMSVTASSSSSCSSSISLQPIEKKDDKTITIASDPTEKEDDKKATIVAQVIKKNALLDAHRDAVKQINSIFKADMPRKCTDVDGLVIHMTMGASVAPKNNTFLAFVFSPDRVVSWTTQPDALPSAYIRYYYSPTTFNSKLEINTCYRIFPNHGICVFVVEAYQLYVKVYHRSDVKAQGFDCFVMPFTHCQHSKDVMMQDIKLGYEVLYISGPITDPVARVLSLQGSRSITWNYDLEEHLKESYDYVDDDQLIMWPPVTKTNDPLVLVSKSLLAKKND